MVKANDLTDMTLVNLYVSGAINIPKEIDVEYTLTNLGDVYRLSVDAGGIRCWNDLADKTEAERVVKFLYIEIGDF